MNKKDSISYYWFEEGWNKGREEAIDEVFSNELLAHGLDERGPLKGTEGFRQFYKQFREQFANIRIEVDIVVKENDMESSLTHVTVTDKASGKELKFSGICMVRILDGKVVEAWNQYDFLSMHQQLGMVLKPAE
jgi:predicted ester cyclase